MHATPFRRLAAAGVTALAIAALPTVAGQQPPKVTMPPAAISVDEAAALAQYWVAIAQRKPAEVALQARQLLERYPQSAAVLATAIEAEIAGSGATTALTQYERWLGGRSVEEPLVVRRIARGVLYEFARQTQDGSARSEALVLLTKDGDPNARALIEANFASGQESAVGEAVRIGDAQAIARVGARLKAPGADKLRQVQLLGESGQPSIVPFLVPLLKDPSEFVRGATALALGRSGNASAQPPLEPLLQDPNGIVRSYAAEALFRLGSTAGLQVLEERASSPEVGARLFAAKAMAGRPDARWRDLVRGILNESDPAHRLDAARLLAPYEPETVRPVLEQLANDPNLAIRDETELVRAELVSTSMSELRGLLRSRNPMVRVRAAGRILAATR